MAGDSGGAMEQGAEAFEPVTLDLRFTGTTGGYFKVWIVNLCLTLLTLGVFSAWAKVRKKRYLYTHTLLDGTPFQYLGRPIPILKGRLIAVVLLAAWYLSRNYFPSFYPFVLIATAVLLPWMLVSSLAFNLRYSAYRGMTFEFRGRYREAASELIGTAFLTFITFGLGYSWAEARIRRFIVRNTRYGDVRARFFATGKDFFRIYIVAALLFGIAAAVVVTFVIGDNPIFLITEQSLLLLTSLMYAAYALAYVYRQAHVTNLVWRSTDLGPISFRVRLRFRDLLEIYVTNIVAIVASLGLLIPWATLRMVRYKISRFSVDQHGPLTEFVGGSARDVRAAAAEVADLFDFDVSL